MHWRYCSLVLSPQTEGDCIFLQTTSSSSGSGGGSGGGTAPDLSQTPFGLGGLGGLSGLGNMGMGSANFMDMQQRMQQEVGAEREEI